MFGRLLQREKPAVLPRRRVESDVPVVRLGVLGAGRIAHEHLKVLAGFDEVDIAGICNRGGTDLTPMAQTYGIGATFSNWREMLDALELDAVLVLVSHFQTVEVTAECLRRGIPCLIEKPAGFTARETEALADVADECGVLNMVAVNRRYYSVINNGLNAVRLHGPVTGVMIEAPEGIRQIRATSRHSADLIDRWLVANTIHALDLFRHVGGDVAEMHSFTSALHEPLADSFSTTMRFAGGALGTFVAHWNAAPGWRMSIYGDGVQADFAPFEKGELRYSDRRVQKIPVAPEDTQYKPGFYGQMRAFIDAVVYDEPLAPPASDLRDAAKTMRFIEQIGGLDG